MQPATLNYTIFSDASITPHLGDHIHYPGPKAMFFQKNLRSKEQDGGTGRHCYAQGQVSVARRTPPAAVLPILATAGFDGHVFWCPRTLHHKFMSYVQTDLRWSFQFFRFERFKEHVTPISLSENPRNMCTHGGTVWSMNIGKTRKNGFC